MSVKQNSVYETLMNEYTNSHKNGLYHQTQIIFSYNSNHIEGNSLTKDQTRTIWETNSFIQEKEQVVKADDILDVTNHFRAFDFILETMTKELSVDYLKELHSIVKAGCRDIAVIGDFKQKPNFVGDMKTTPPKAVEKAIKILLEDYNPTADCAFNDIVDFHFHFEKIHPFEDGNGRVGRLIMFKECLKSNVAPFIIDEKHRLFYYRGLQKYEENKGFLIDTCLSCQDEYKELLAYFEIKVDETNDNIHKPKGLRR